MFGSFAYALLVSLTLQQWALAYTDNYQLLTAGDPYNDLKLAWGSEQKRGSFVKMSRDARVLGLLLASGKTSSLSQEQSLMDNLKSVIDTKNAIPTTVVKEDRLAYNMTITEFNFHDNKVDKSSILVTADLMPWALQYADLSTPVWPILLHGISEATKDSKFVVGDYQNAADSAESVLPFNCAGVEAACRLGSLISRVMGRPVKAQKVDKVSRQKGDKAPVDIVQSARAAAVIWNEKDEVKLPFEISDEGEIKYRNSRVEDQKERGDRYLQENGQVFLFID